jgi:L-ascorbate metabolism protein UlaG (beta-lactamase superfamily)
MSRFSLLVLSVALLTGAPILGQEKKWSPIDITWRGQSFFEVKSSKGTTVIFDPHAIPEYGRFVGVKADLVLISHNHNDHTQVGVIENIKEAKIIPGLKGVGMRATWNIVDEQFKDIRIRSVGVYHDDSEGMKYGRNTVFILELDGWRVVHLGDLGHPLSAEQVKRIGPVDVLMIPVGGIYTLNGSEAKKVVEQLKPKEYIFPMHHGTKVYDDLLPPTEFLEDQDRAKVTSSTDNKLTLNRDPQRPRPLIVQLHYWPKNRKE